MFAGEPMYLVRFQVGWLWFFTPIKDGVLVDWTQNAVGNIVPSWYFVKLGYDSYLDLRLLIIQATLVAMLLWVVPRAVRRVSPGERRIGTISRVLGALLVAFVAINASSNAPSGLYTFVIVLLSLGSIAAAFVVPGRSGIGSRS